MHNGIKVNHHLRNEETRQTKSTNAKAPTQSAKEEGVNQVVKSHTHTHIQRQAHTCAKQIKRTLDWWA